MPSSKPSRPYVVRNSKIHGRGVFATRTIRKGARIIEYRGQRTTWDEALERPASDPRDPNHTFFFETSDGRVIDANVRGNAARWINHSCDANAQSFEYDDGRVFIEARRTIRRGDEITYDYRLTVDGPLTKRTLADYACRCGAAKCRGVLLLLPRRKRIGKSTAKAAARRQR
jgi:SET domain-containing protein